MRTLILSLLFILSEARPGRVEGLIATAPSFDSGLAALAQDKQEGKGLQISWIDVEGGAATLVVTPDGESLLMDCGWPGKRDAERVANAAKAAGVSKIDHYLTSHWHADHVGGVGDLVQA